MRGEHRKAPRVQIEHSHPVNLMGVDGTWRRSCFLLDVSDSGAKLEVEGPVNVLQAREFFLRGALYPASRPRPAPGVAWR